MAIEAGRIVTTADFARLVGTETQRTANGSAHTAETVEDSVTVSLVSGTSYRVIWDGAVHSSVAGDVARCRIREDNISGTEMQLRNSPALLASAASLPMHLEGKYIASATGSKTFVATTQRLTGTGNITAQAGGTSPTSFRVEVA